MALLPPPDEASRLAALRQLDVLDTPPEAEYDDLTRLASAICGTPIALVSLLDADRQWFKSRVGLGATETHRDLAFCDHAIRQPDLFTVPDATADDRFRDNPLVTGDPHIRLYAGVPLATPEGHNVGTLCVIDRTPRALTPAQEDALGVLARQVMAQMQLRRQAADARRELAERHKAEAALRESEAMFRNTVDRLAEGVCVVDVATRRFVEANAAILAMLGYAADEFRGLSQFDLVHGMTPEAFGETIDRVRGTLHAEGRCDLGRRTLKRKDGTPVPVDIKVTVVPNGGAGLRAVIVRDETEQVRYEEQLFRYQDELERANEALRASATTDGLTGVRNRAAFNDRLHEEFERATRYGRPLSVVLMDVDHFKQFNDTFGHPAGDDVLRVVARTVGLAARSTDVVARYGGEEFVVLLPDTDYGGAMVLAERCRRAVAGVSWDRRPVTVSVGVATLTAGTRDAAALVQEADDALYRSKQAGRNRVSHGSGAVAAFALTR